MIVGNGKVEEMEELKRCPFCGGEANVKMEYKDVIGGTIWCGCDKCHAETSGYCPDLSKEHRALDDIDYCKKLVIKAWNRRVK